MRFKSLMLSLALVGAMAMPLLYAAPAQAQATRTWVSGVGDDANPCSRTAPCKTWAGAISKTAPGGEIDALDPGGFGAVTITKSITLDGGGGQVASVLVAGTNGIVVQAGAADIVIIKNIRFQGLRGAGNANAGLDAIKFNAGASLIVENCEIYGFNNNGIEVSSPGGYAAILNTQIMNVGLSGVTVNAASPFATAEVDKSQVYVSKFGFAAATGNKLLVSNSVASKASTTAIQGDGGSTVALDSNVISFSIAGISGGGTIQSWNNNRMFGNTSNGVTPSFISGTLTEPMGMDGR
jgi:hypothetical protein